MLCFVVSVDVSEGLLGITCVKGESCQSFIGWRLPEFLVCDCFCFLGRNSIVGIEMRSRREIVGNDCTCYVV